MWLEGERVSLTHHCGARMLGSASVHRGRVARARFTLLLGLALAAPLSAQTSERALYSATEPDVPEKVGKVLRAHRIQERPPLLDGALDEPAWLVADSATDMAQWDPDNMAPMTERTVVRVLYDERYVYVGAELRER